MGVISQASPIVNTNMRAEVLRIIKNREDDRTGFCGSLEDVIMDLIRRRDGHRRMSVTDAIGHVHNLAMNGIIAFHKDGSDGEQETCDVILCMDVLIERACR